MKALYPTLAIAALAFAACDDDSYNDWTPAQSNPNTTEEQRIAISFSVADADAIKFADLAEGTDSVKIFTPTLTSTGQTADAIAYKVLIANATEEVSVSNDGKIAVADLKAAIEAEYGKAPYERELPSTLVAYTTYGSLTSRETAEFKIVATLTAPEIEEAYYYIGATNGWSVTDQTYKFTRADESVSVYDDPVFTCVVPAPYTADETTGEQVRADNWFKIAPASAYSLEDFWSGKILGCATNGDESLSLNLVNENAQAFNQPATDGALKYKITLNMMEYTITIEPISYVEWIYVPGNGQGWSPETAPALHSPNLDGVYTGYAVMNGDFKFTKERAWAAEYNSTAFTTYGDGFGTEADNTNIKCFGDAGIYYITADVANGTLSGVLCNYGIIGPAAGGWETDVDMTFDAETNTYKFTGELVAGEYKFRANDGWDINLGGSLDDLVAGGDNLTLAEAGNYTIILNPLITTDGGKMTATITKN